MTNIDRLLFKRLEQATIKCGGNIGGCIYINFFQNKTGMSLDDFNRFKRDIFQEIQIKRNSKLGLKDYEIKIYDELLKLL